MDTQHTAVPWRAEGGMILAGQPRQVAGGTVSKAICQMHGTALVGEARANQRFIVKACNSHDKMREACEAMAAWDRSHDDAEILSRACSLARAAIADAKTQETT